MRLFPDADLCRRPKADTTMITIEFLADHLDAIPTLIKWFRDQWPDYYEDLSPAEMEQDFLEDVSRNSLPSRLVAFEDNALAGTIVLRENGGTMPPEFRPELGGLYVVESHRRRGIATELVRAGMKLALDQGYETVFATTVSAAGILEHLGWEFIKTVVHSDGELSLYRCKLYNSA
ncbi:MAG: GNAT family N-acetyltransferase [Anaerolineales bacterium]|nr:GNAT family N-acetyltransferase [Anaerolineales bacterium]